MNTRGQLFRLLPCLCVGVCFLGSLALGQVNEMVIHSFGGSDGEEPSGKLVLGSDGMLYGGTVHGGTNDSGTVFKMRVDGTGFTVLHRFGANANDGVYVMGGIMAPARLRTRSSRSIPTARATNGCILLMAQMEAGPMPL
jgi:uncharacterized repeat protein (TIGR03803 family)